MYVHYLRSTCITCTYVLHAHTHTYTPSRLLDKFEVYEQDPDNYFTSIHHTPQPPCHTYLPLQQHVGASVPKLPIPSLPRVNFNLQTPPTVSYRPVSSTVGGMFSSSATGTRDKIGFDRLSRSLLSGFPNEVDLVFNILTVLAYKAPGAIPIAEVRVQARLGCGMKQGLMEWP